MANNGFYRYLTVLRVMGMFFIIGTHVIGTPVVHYYSEYSPFWLWFSTVLTLVFRGGVYIFIMISGALFLQPDKDITLKQLFSKYILRLIIVLLTFGTFFTLSDIVFSEKRFYLKQLLIAVLRIIKGENCGHFWYLYMLIGLYLVTPVFKYFIKLASDIEIKYVLGIFFISSMLFPFIEKYTGLHIAFNIPLVGTYLFYYLFGYVLHSKILKIPNIFAISMIVISIIVYIAEYFLKTQINIDKVYFEGISGTQIFMSLIPLAIFSFVLNVNEKKTSAITSIEKELSNLSFGVYIIHPFIIHFLYRVINISPINTPILLMWIIVFTVTSFLSIIITWCFRLIAFVRKFIL